MLSDENIKTVRKKYIHANNARNKVLDVLDLLVHEQEKNARLGLQESSYHFYETRTLVIMISLFALLIGAIISLLVVRESSKKTSDMDEA